MAKTSNRERAKAWLRLNGLARGRSDWAHDKDVESLESLLVDAERRGAEAEAAKDAERRRMHDNMLDNPIFED